MSNTNLYGRAAFRKAEGAYVKPSPSITERGMAMAAASRFAEAEHGSRQLRLAIERYFRDHPEHAGRALATQPAGCRQPEGAS